MSKRLTKAIESLGVETMKELEAMSKEDLSKRVIQAEQAMREAVDELEKNPKFQDLKESLRDLTAGKRGVDKRQQAIILVSLSLMELK